MFILQSIGSTGDNFECNKDYNLTESIEKFSTVAFVDKLYYVCTCLNNVLVFLCHLWLAKFWVFPLICNLKCSLYIPSIYFLKLIKL